MEVWQQAPTAIRCFYLIQAVDMVKKYLKEIIEQAFGLEMLAHQNMTTVIWILTFVMMEYYRWMEVKIGLDNQFVLYM